MSVFLSEYEIVEAIISFSGNARFQLSVWDEIRVLYYSMLIDGMDYIRFHSMHE